MKLTFKKAVVFILAACLLLGILAPVFTQLVQAAENVCTGTLVSDNVISEYKSGVFIGLTQNKDGQDLLAVPIYGKKMVVYNLDTWEVADEVYTGVSNPRGATVTSDGRVWVCGDTRTICCYDPKTRECFISPNMGLGAGSAFAMTQGTDGDLYFGTYSNARIARYDIDTNTFTDLGTPQVPKNADDLPVYESFSYASAVVQKGDYIYASVHGRTAHKLVKLNLDGSLVTSLDIAAEMGTTRYLTGLNFIPGTDVLVGYGTNAANGAITVDATTMTKLDNLGGYATAIKGNVSEICANKVYFASYEDITVGEDTYQDVLYTYDLTTQTASPVQTADGGYLYGNILRGNAGSLVDGIDYLGISGPCLVTVQDTIIIIYDVENAVRYQFSGDGSPAKVSQGTGQPLRAATLGLSGSNDIYFGAYDTNVVVSYDTATGSISKVTEAAGSQTDSFCWYNDILYCGNYNVASLTRIENGNSASLFQLNNETFEQARIHTITAGNNKIFAGTTPDMYYHGGMIAWYDMDDGLTYVVTGPEKSDVYYAQTFNGENYTASRVDSGLVKEEDIVWYNAATNAVATPVRDNFTWLIEGQCINKLIYDEASGLLYGTSSTYGGTNTDPLTDRNAVLFVYDVNAMQLVTTYDLTTDLGLTTQVAFIAGIEKDPDYESNGKFWGVVSETLFTFTYDERANTFNVSEKLSFAKDTYWNGGSRSWFPRSFAFSDGYLYVAFDKVGGLCKVNMADTSVYQQLITDSDDANDVPNSYVISEDGDLYYVANGALHMINLNPTAAENEKAAAVNALIAALPETVTVDNSELIHQAQAAYEALTVQARALVSNEAMLEDAWIELMKAQIDALGISASYADRETIQAVMADYDKVPLERRSEITNYAVLAELNDTVLESKYGVVGGGLYASLDKALEAAPEGGQIDLLENASETAVVLTKGVTLDLCGYTLYTDSLTADVEAMFADGYVTDSSCGNDGLIKADKGSVSLWETNPDLPLYDKTAGGYRFFDYDLSLHKTSEKIGTGREKFWFKFQFRKGDDTTELDQDAYDLVAAGGSGLHISTKLTWKGNYLKTVAFGYNGVVDAFSADWAGKASAATWLYLIVGGMEDFVMEGELLVEPIIRVNGVVASSGTIKYNKTSDVEFGYIDKP